MKSHTSAEQSCVCVRVWLVSVCVCVCKSFSAVYAVHVMGGCMSVRFARCCVPVRTAVPIAVSVP